MKSPSLSSSPAPAPLSASTTALFTCKCMGIKCREIMDQSTNNNPLTGIVLNVFDRTINVKIDDNDELLVLSLGEVASPITVNIVLKAVVPKRQKKGNRLLLNSLSDFVFPGDQVSIMMSKTFSYRRKASINTAKISLGKATILIERPNYFENKIQEFTEHSLRNFLIYSEHLLYVLMQCAKPPKQGCLLNPDMTTKGLLSEFLATICNNGNDRLRVTDIGSQEFVARLHMALLGLCGRGPGFTPAGDDFISGFVTMLNCIRKSFNMGPAIIPGSEFARLTTWTSFKLMEYNARGQVDIEIQELINSAAKGDALSYADKVRSLSNRGHTSGLDFSTGATFALCMAADSI